MDSTVVAVIFLSVLTPWIFNEHSVAGRYCRNGRQQYVFRPDLIPFNPIQWFVSPFAENENLYDFSNKQGRNRIEYGRSTNIDIDDVLSFRRNGNTDSEISLRTGERQPTNDRPTFRNYPYPYGMYSPGFYPPSMYKYWPPYTPVSPELKQFSDFSDQYSGENFLNPNKQEFDAINNHPGWRHVDREQCGESLADRIIGGTEATLGQYPWLALIGFKNRSDPESESLFSCGGALITPCWVLSAAHCVTHLPEDFYVSAIRLGEHNLDTTVDCDTTTCAPPHQDFTPVRIIRHKYFNNPKLKNDVSLIKMERPAIISQWVQPICLPYGKLLSANFVGKMGEVAGWGIENISTGQSSRILKTVKLPVRDNSVCQNTYKSNAQIGDNQLCVGGIIGFDSCNGDSGGPFMRADVANNTTPKYYMIGIVSFGAKKCGIKPSPGVYTKVAKFMDWILDRITEC